MTLNDDANFHLRFMKSDCEPVSQMKKKTELLQKRNTLQLTTAVYVRLMYAHNGKCSFYTHFWLQFHQLNEEESKNTPRERERKIVLHHTIPCTVTTSNVETSSESENSPIKHKNPL